jgi:translation initiation factor 4A
MEDIGSFDDLKLKDDVLRGVYGYGFENPSRIQYTSIPKFLSGKDLIAQAQSGTGKTGAFTIASLNKVDPELKKTQILILSPTHELTGQITDVLIELNKYTKYSILKLIGGMNTNECCDLLSKDPQIIVGTPGKILDLIIRKRLFTDSITTFILDEADEMLSYGFQESISNIISFLSKECQICLYSATIPTEILDLTEKFMDNPERILINNEELTLDGIKQFYINSKNSEWKVDIIKDLYEMINIGQCIIYINSKDRLNKVYRELLDSDFAVNCISGEKTIQERKQIMEEFRRGEIRTLLSTDLLARGIDIQQLSLVINYDIPIDKEVYIHRIGRSGRYGRKGVAINLITDKDYNKLNELKSFYDTKIDEMPNDISEYLKF